MDLVGLSLLIIAIAFVVLVFFAVKLIKNVSETVEESKKTITLLTGDVNVTLKQTNDLLAKANILVEDVNGKVATIDPLFTAVAELSESVSDLNTQARTFGQKATDASSNVSHVSKAYTVAKIAKKIFKK
ncbi:DUF948 domain-containing protein [Streptococcus zalophi]|uniref:DUF948 domain-containing protein n=1 Tax=Streptococcus zalophi TaxID=640031 RepID=UPI00215B8F96|nr:DUF948 domain-containing protein [Streptococcus zalophi]MCR8967193.1 DUF948 domain-containing protein [Streptococcus zalophi]